MRVPHPENLRVGLLLHSFKAPAETEADGAAKELADGLVERGHEAFAFAAHDGPWERLVKQHRDVVYVRRLSERTLTARGFVGPVSHLPMLVLALLEERVNVVHAFTAVDAQAALVWRRLTGKPAVFSFVDPPRREELSDQRLKLRFLSRALRSDAVTAMSAETREAMQRWLAIDAPVIEPGDASGYEAMYQGLLER